MKTLSFVLVLTVVGCARRPGSPDLAAIERLQQRDIAASRAYDVDTLLSLVSQDVVSLPPGSEPSLGRDATGAMLRQGRGAQILEYNQDWKDTQVAGDYAFQWGFISGAMRPQPGAEIVRYRFKALRVLRKEAGEWKVFRTMWN